VADPVRESGVREPRRRWSALGRVVEFGEDLVERDRE
jgi:hypothetical protein